MIKRLRLKFIVLSMIAVVVLLAAIVVSMNIINYNTVVRDADEVLSVLSGNGGVFPGGPGGRPDGTMNGDSNRSADAESKGEDQTGFGKDPGEFFGTDDEFTGDIPHGMSPEVPYESRFFSVLLNASGEVESCDISRIKAVEEETAEEYALAVYPEGKERGFVNNYRFVRVEDDDAVRIIFLDIGRKLEAYSNFRNASMAMAGVGLLLFFIVIFLFSKRIVRPAAEAYEKQKRFISDAGHEIKTPITIIRADADILEMDYENNEWVEDIQKQTERLAELTNDLIYLSKTEEGASSMQFTDLPISEVVEDMVDSFQTLAKSQGKDIRKDIEAGLFCKGDEKALSRLVSILMDNAVKYSPENGVIEVKLKKSNRGVALSVYNETENEIEKDKLKLLFDRFYRTDASRNSKTGGYGIGLSMAKAITEAHGGKITAASDDGKSLIINVEI